MSAITGGPASWSASAILDFDQQIAHGLSTIATNSAITLHNSSNRQIPNSNLGTIAMAWAAWHQSRGTHQQMPAHYVGVDQFLNIFFEWCF